MDLHDYATYDAVGLRELISAGDVTAAEVETAARQALAEVNPRLNALALPVFEPALGHAADGPFTGVPFLIKDHGPVAEGVPFFLGSRSLPAGVVPGHDTDLMARFRAAGLVTLGLTTAPEMSLSFATESVRFGVTRNPWHPERGAGGSSGGAAALVAAGAVPVAHASDGAGSIRVPASCCGLVGLKPSRGRLPCGPDVGEPMLGMANEFALTRTVRDAAHLLDAVHGPGIGDKYTAPPPARRYAAELGADPGRLRVAVTTAAWSGAKVDDEVAAAAIETGRVLERLGHHVDAVGPRVDWPDVVRSWVTEAVAVASMVLLAPRRPDPALLEAVSRRFLETADAFSALDLLAGLNAQNRVTRSVSAFFTEHDLLVTPTLARPPAPHGTLRYDDPAHTLPSWLDAMSDYGPFTVLFNITGHPAISLPLGHDAGGLPVGVQLVAAHGREDLLLRVASCLEQAMPWRERVPPVFAGRGSRG
ncbi:amidase [Nonomuraea sp. NN258]|uniref:amidase n=1 Tax=Nonomuraea antri TaxID=2730852 RepID=UPI0015683B88|nr:amidase family protein [Nonomuraea antri]NRQ30975.1 amidase [Nonomuraea antri]